jgi:hypothetical protein
VKKIDFSHSPESQLDSFAIGQNEVSTMRQTLKYCLPAFLLILYGCGGHYLVHDPASGANYYTKDIDRVGDSGAVKFKDHATGSNVTIQQSEVKKISEDEYEAAVKRHE